MTARAAIMAALSAERGPAAAPATAPVLASMPSATGFIAAATTIGRRVERRDRGGVAGDADAGGQHVGKIGLDLARRLQGAPQQRDRERHDRPQR